MKVYVIKNKDGEYWCGNDTFSATVDTGKIYVCEDFDFISKFFNRFLSEGLLTDCKIVPITIYEGDLEKETRKQVCDEVRKVIDYYREWYEQGYIINMREEDLQKEIDKIEQAREGEKGDTENNSK